MQELIIVKQLPIIEQHLKELAVEIDQKTELVSSLICTEDTVKEVKKARADLNKQFTELEEQRKTVKAAVLEPYNQFEQIYKEYVGDKFKFADNVLKAKIDEVQNELKISKETEIKRYFEEYKMAIGIEWLAWEMSGITVLISTTTKKMKEQVKEFIDRVAADISIIKMQEDAAEILVEYQKTRNLQTSIHTVKDRKERLEQMRATEEAMKATEAEKVAHATEVEKQVEILSAPTVEKPQDNKPKLFKAVFTVKGTIEELKALKAFLDERGIKYEC